MNFINFNAITHREAIKHAKDVARESKCVSRQVGASLITKHGHLVAACNGTISGDVNCCDIEHCDHRTWSDINEIHAEMNVLAKCAKSGISTNNAILYSTTAPCHNCAKHIVAFGIKEVYYIEEYDRSDLSYLKRNGVKVFKYED